MPGEEIAETKTRKRWQIINIIWGLLIIGSIFYFFQSQPPFVIVLRIIPAIILILTRKNNIFSSLVLLLFGLTVFFLTTLDGFLVLGSAIYMFISAILRMFKVKGHAVIGLAITIILGLGLFWDYTTTFISRDNLNLAREKQNNIRIELVGDTGQISTSFYFNRGIYPRGAGLSKGTYVYQVISESKGIVVPLGQWPIFKIKAGGAVAQRGLAINLFDLKNVALHGGFNQEGRFPLSLGDYTIQLIRIEKSQGKNIGTIIAESNFSIVPYDRQILAKLTAYLAVDGDEQKYYDTYTKKGNDSVTAWVQSPPGEVISGTVKSYMTNLEGEIDEKSWIGVSEEPFRTDFSGQPVSLRNLSGNPLPGIYHYEILIDGQTIFDLKYDCIPPSL